ncbi:LuxR C-terminal-related transcriptional regulator [Cyclobacterium plantarum]|uniref:LuxR C-terminal-related transcriptional regulator n=1 Tax=Cyclobacterium plantarum TaxID=2716263 RepID=UPI003F715611
MGHITDKSTEIATTEVPLEYAHMVEPYLLKRLDFGPSFYFIYHFSRSKYVYVESRIEPILQFTPREMMGSQKNFFLSRMHPDDLHQHQQAMKEWQKFFFRLPISERNYYSTSFDFRFRKKNGQYQRMLQQLIFIEHDSEGNLLYSLEKCTLISHWEKTKDLVLCVCGPNANKILISNHTRRLNKKNRQIFTPSEIRILKLLSNGLNSLEVANQLNISVHTVNTHRRNMLRKTGINSTILLVKFAKNNDLLVY